MVKKIELMADYNCYPLWWANGDGNIDPSTLPLTSKTLKSLEEWAAIYDTLLNEDDPAASGFPNDEARDVFDQKGISLWQLVQKELGLEYEVGYFSERFGKHLTHLSQIEAAIALSK